MAKILNANPIGSGILRTLQLAHRTPVFNAGSTKDQRTAMEGNMVITKIWLMNKSNGLVAGKPVVASNVCIGEPKRFRISENFELRDSDQYTIVLNYLHNLMYFQLTEIWFKTLEIRHLPTSYSFSPISYYIKHECQIHDISKLEKLYLHNNIFLLPAENSSFAEARN